jgi:uncharacterized membrane protein YGL010W
MPQLFFVTCTAWQTTMRKVNDWLNEYSQSHQNALNKTIHWICVPSIVFSILLIISAVPMPDAFERAGIHFPHVITGLALLYYFMLSIPLALGMSVIFAMMNWGAIVIANQSPLPSWEIGIFIFVIAWIGQFYGHHVEGKKPSFLKDIQFLLIGPLWLLHFVYKRLGLPY